MDWDQARCLENLSEGRGRDWEELTPEERKQEIAWKFRNTSRNEYIFVSYWHEKIQIVEVCDSTWLTTPIEIEGYAVFTPRSWVHKHLNTLEPLPEWARPIIMDLGFECPALAVAMAATNDHTAGDIDTPDEALQAEIDANPNFLRQFDFCIVACESPMFGTRFGLYARPKGLELD